MNGSVYERELRHILAGDEKYLRSYSKKLENWGNELGIFLRKPFFVTRSAGSLGADLIAIRHDISLIIEVKSSERSTITFSEGSGQRQEQAERLTKMCENAGLFIMYAYRLKNAERGDPWRLFSFPANPQGTARILHMMLPKPSVTKDGYFGLRWNDGLPLSEFIRWVNRLS